MIIVFGFLFSFCMYILLYISILLENFFFCRRKYNYMIIKIFEVQEHFKLYFSPSCNRALYVVKNCLYVKKRNPWCAQIEFFKNSRVQWLFPIINWRHLPGVTFHSSQSFSFVARVSRDIDFAKHVQRAIAWHLPSFTKIHNL